MKFNEEQSQSYGRLSLTVIKEIESKTSFKSHVLK